MGNFREGAKWYAKGWGIALLPIGTFLTLVLVITLATGSLQKWTADFRGDVKAKEQTKANGSFRIATYEHFWGLCSSVQSDEDAIRNAQEEIDLKETSDDRRSRLRQVITATKNTRAESIRQYNTDAQSEYKEAFLDADLPYTLVVGSYNTQCGRGPSGN